MPPRYAKETEVAASQTRVEIEALLQRFGCTQFGIAHDTEAQRASVAFVFQGQPHRIVLPLPDPQSREITHYRNGNGWAPRRTKRELRTQAATPTEALQQATDSRWRALLLMLRGQLEYADLTGQTPASNLTQFRVLGDGRTVAEHVTGSGDVPALTWGRS